MLFFDFFEITMAVGHIQGHLLPEITSARLN